LYTHPPIRVVVAKAPSLRITCLFSLTLSNLHPPQPLTPLPLLRRPDLSRQRVR
jgi:hypothetical protein